ncbi:MAG: PD-(D/E)XK nuclease family protein [Muribaculaceae bacterium]|nr:PD-(D/E)XK nuclease family protein [Muribaculaceae bacterium]
MATDRFLQSVAAYYAEVAPGRPAPEEVVYVLPNKRSAMFLKKYVREQVHGVALMPRFMTMRTFASLHAPYPEAAAREQLFILYTAYRSVMEERGRLEGAREFDSFIFWGDMMLSDFDDIDRSMVNADELFRNLRDVKEIQADYLDEDQKEVVRRVWGESRLTADVDTFWMHVGGGDEADSLSAKFVYLWEILADVYHRFHALLAERGLASAGGQFRAALDTVRGLDASSVPEDTHYVFVGFNDLSTVETLIFDRLHRLGIASFFWDTAPLQLVEDGSELPPPLSRIASLARSFPMPDDYVLPPAAAESPEITVTAVPSNTGQAKAIHSVLEQWAPYIDSRNPLNTAVVLPDQGLLLPALLSIPDGIEAVNISMGLPYRTTTFASLFSSIISMQLRAREIRGTLNFYYEDVDAVIAHPHIKLIAGDTVEKLTTHITENKLYNIPVNEILNIAPELAPVFAPVRSLSSVADVSAYLTTLFDWLAGCLAEAGRGVRAFEIEAVKYFRSEVESITELALRYGVTMNERTFLHLFERIFNNRGLTVEGTPLEGLQMLGVLETRALDFDNVVVLSMNERIFPRRQYSKTMIPGKLRRGFGLPDFESLEWTYAYSFYRLLARARRVALFYDSRPEGRGNGEMSRYISQMRYLMPRLRVDMRSLSYLSHSSVKPTLAVPKTADVMALLDKFRAGGPQRFSASALKTYKACPMKFYLAYVRNMRGSDELVDYLSAAQFGTAVHNTIQGLFEPLEGSLITPAIIDRWLDERCPEVDTMARMMVVKERYPKVEDAAAVELTVDADIACRLVASIARANLRAERDFYCRDGRSFTFIANEMKVRGVWTLADDLAVNFFMAIDRVDGIDASTMRFVDFKTGGDDTKAESIDGLLSNKAKDGMFQLFIYAQAYRDMVDAGMEIVPVLHPMRKFSAGEDLAPLFIGKNAVGAYSVYEDEFRPKLVDFVRSIFDPEVPFTQCADSTGCKYCQFKPLCGRF